MAQYGFGSGVVFAVPLTNAQGNPLASGTPVRFGVLQDVSVDFSFTNKELHGQNQFEVTDQSPSAYGPSINHNDGPCGVRISEKE